MPRRRRHIINVVPAHCALANRRHRRARWHPAAAAAVATRYQSLSLSVSALCAELHTANAQHKNQLKNHIHYTKSETRGTLVAAWRRFAFELRRARASALSRCCHHLLRGYTVYCTRSATRRN